MIFLLAKYCKAIFIRLQSYYPAGFDLFWNVLEPRKGTKHGGKQSNTGAQRPAGGLTDSQTGPNRIRTMRRLEVSSTISFLSVMIPALVNLSCAPRIINVTPLEGAPATTITVSMEYLVGWPRVEISDKLLEWPQLKLIAASPERRDVPGEELVWIEDKLLQFVIPDISPGEYVVTIHDDKGPPGDSIYSALETTAYIAFPPVWPFVFRSNQTQFNLRVLPKN